MPTTDMKQLARRALSAARARTKVAAERLGIWETKDEPAQPQVVDARTFLACRYLRGQGIEIGALHHPLKVPPEARVTYVDRLSVPDLRTHYPELAELPLVEVDVVDDGERLSKFEAKSQDFVVANHFLEHCENPMGALLNMLRVLKDGSVLYLAIPDKRHTFDRDRPVTTIEHVLRDYREGPEWSRRQHYEEYARLVDKVTDERAVAEAVERQLAIAYSIHFHVWTLTEMLELVTTVRGLSDIPFEIEAVHRNDDEVIFLLRRNGPTTA